MGSCQQCAQPQQPCFTHHQTLIGSCGCQPLDRGTESDVAEAQAAVERLAGASADEDLVREIWLLGLRALLARAHGDDTVYRDYRDRYRDMARTLGYEGHIAWAEAMP